MKYEIIATSNFKKKLKAIKKRNKDIEKLRTVINHIANNEKYKDHQLFNSTKYQNCRELYIEPDWLLVYRIDNNKLILLLVDTGSLSDLF